MFDPLDDKKPTKKGKTPINQLSKTTNTKRERVKKLKKMIARRKEERKKKKQWSEYLIKLAKGKLAKGEKPPF